MEKPSQSWRIFRRDGGLNVSREGLKRFPFYDMYHALLSMPTRKFFLLVVLIYLLINFFFSGLYFLCGPEAFVGVRTDQPLFFWEECFFFSVQTFATIGYGHTSPIGLWANLLVTAEALAGLLTVALMTGLLFARFSRPTARVIFSNVAIISIENGVPSLMFRVANQRLNQIAEAKMGAVLVKNETSQQGEKYRKIYDLALERSHSPVFALSWTVIHPVIPSSPLYGLDEKQLRECEAEILATLSGIDDVFSQSIYTRFSYTADDVLWKHRFKDIISFDPQGRIVLDFKGIHETIPAE